MQRYLYLLRHAQSAEKQPGQTDRQRELTATGMRQALQIGALLRAEKTYPDIIVCSNAQRAILTARYVAEGIRYPEEQIRIEEELYEPSTRSLISFLKEMSDEHLHVLCISHNPAISYLAESLTKAEIGAMVPGGMTIISFALNSWKEIGPGNGSLVRYSEPPN